MSQRKDLNLRPLGYEGKSTYNSRQVLPTQPAQYHNSQISSVGLSPSGSLSTYGQNTDNFVSTSEPHFWFGRPLIGPENPILEPTVKIRAYLAPLGRRTAMSH